MGTRNKNQVQFVISHLEGCSGNFLGRLYADKIDPTQSFFRTDTDQHSCVLAINGVSTWEEELERLTDHRVVVTHNFNQKQILDTFPNVKLIQLYPYTHIGNVLYNICFKKLNTSLPNLLDNHLLHISEWYNRIIQRQPDQLCVDFWKLTDRLAVEQLLETSLTESQQQFFDRYWQNQLMYPLNIPEKSLSIKELVSFWEIDNYFNDWSVAWTIFVFELINNKSEHQRLWSVDVDQFDSWDDLEKIESKYHNSLTIHTK